jgi:hypothetical protein
MPHFHRARAEEFALLLRQLARVRFVGADLVRDRKERAHRLYFEQFAYPFSKLVLLLRIVNDDGRV